MISIFRYILGIFVYCVRIKWLYSCDLIATENENNNIHDAIIGRKTSTNKQRNKSMTNGDGEMVARNKNDLMRWQ